jgi:DNA polymerase-1
MQRLLFDVESNGFLANATKVHCVAVEDVDTGEQWDFKPDQIKEAGELLSQADVLIGHNIQRFDVPLLFKLVPSFVPKHNVRIIDTMVCARVIYPNVKATDAVLIRKGQMPPGREYQGKHTIGSWGYRLGCPKGDYAKARTAAFLILYPHATEEEIARYVWGEWNQDMHDYMLQDRSTNVELWQHLKVDNYAPAAIELEHRANRVCDAIQDAGVPFNRSAAVELHAKLVARKADIEKQLCEQFGFWYQPVSPDPAKATFTPKQPSTKPAVATLGEDGCYTWSNPSYWGEYSEEENDVWNERKQKMERKRAFIGYPCTKLKKVEFNPGSRAHIARLLKLRGWEPTEFTDSGEPSLTEEVLENVVQLYPEFNGIGEYLMLEKRLGQLAEGDKAWLAYMQDDGRIHGAINPMGTITSRGAHFAPNLGQVPNAASPYGHECRQLFYAPAGYSFLGADMSGLELRGLAHFLHPYDGGAYMKQVLEGDVHWANAIAMGLADGPRDKSNPLHTIVREDGSKRIIYATIYGAWDDKIGELVFATLSKARRDCGEEGLALYQKFFKSASPSAKQLRAAGQRVREGLIKGIAGFEDLKEKIALQVEKKGWVPGLDKRRIPIRSDHSALNFMIQSAGAILCKRWMCDAFDELCAKYRLGIDFQLVLWVHDELQLLVRKGLEKEIGDIVVKNAKTAGEPYGFRGPLDSEAKVGSNWDDTH